MHCILITPEGKINAIITCCYTKENDPCAGEIAQSGEFLPFFEAEAGFSLHFSPQKYNFF